jgi:hypothetical protein
MSDTAQKRALRNYRSRLTKRGIARFEVLGLDADRDLIRSIARRLAEDGPDSARIRSAIGHRPSAIGRTISGDPPKRGGILEALRRSPLVAPISNSRVPGKPAARLAFDPLPSRHKYHQQYNEAGPVRIAVGMDGCAIRWRFVHLLPDDR